METHPSKSAFAISRSVLLAEDVSHLAALHVESISKSLLPCEPEGRLFASNLVRFAC